MTKFIFIFIIIGFYILFSLAITSSVQLVGVYVVFASLILPALTALKALNPYKVAWTSGLISVVLGILLSIIFDLPAGPILVVSYVIVTILIVLIKKMNNINI